MPTVIMIPRAIQVKKLMSTGFVMSPPIQIHFPRDLTTQEEFTNIDSLFPIINFIEDQINDLVILSDLARAFVHLDPVYYLTIHQSASLRLSALNYSYADYNRSHGFTDFGFTKVVNDFVGTIKAIRPDVKFSSYKAELFKIFLQNKLSKINKIPLAQLQLFWIVLFYHPVIQSWNFESKGHHRLLVVPQHVAFVCAMLKNFILQIINPASRRLWPQRCALYEKKLWPKIPVPSLSQESLSDMGVRFPVSTLQSPESRWIDDMPSDAIGGIVRGHTCLFYTLDDSGKVYILFKSDTQIGSDLKVIKGGFVGIGTTKATKPRSLLFEFLYTQEMLLLENIMGVVTYSHPVDLNSQPKNIALQNALDADPQNYFGWYFLKFFDHARVERLYGIQKSAGMPVTVEMIRTFSPIQKLYAFLTLLNSILFEITVNKVWVTDIKFDNVCYTRYTDSRFPELFRFSIIDMITYAPTFCLFKNEWLMGGIFDITLDEYSEYLEKLHLRGLKSADGSIVLRVTPDEMNYLNAQLSFEISLIFVQLWNNNPVDLRLVNYYSKGDMRRAEFSAELDKKKLIEPFKTLLIQSIYDTCLSAPNPALGTTTGTKGTGTRYFLGSLAEIGNVIRTVCWQDTGLAGGIEEHVLFGPLYLALFNQSNLKSLEMAIDQFPLTTSPFSNKPPLYQLTSVE